MPQKIILFNGPPSSGKDTAALHLFHHRDFTRNRYVVFDRLSMPLKRAFAAVTATTISGLGHSIFEDTKEDVIPGFGVSYRQWQIDFSEKFMKPLYGEDIFAKLFIERNSTRHSKDAIILVPDCGFNIEYSTLSDHYGSENILVIKLYRPGTTWTNDSRGYLRVGSDFIHPIPGVENITNAETREEFEAKILATVTKWLSQ